MSGQREVGQQIDICLHAAIVLAFCVWRGAMAGRGGLGGGRGGRGGSRGGGGRPGGGFGGDEVILEDPCDIMEDAPLQGVRQAIERVRIGETLRIGLRGSGPTASVTCVLPGTGEIVGYPTFDGIAKLIRCLERGNSYIGQVVYLDGSDCIVRIMRSGTVRR